MQMLLRWLRRPENAVAVAIVALAALLRFWDLGSRAIHHDESLHGYYSWFLAEFNVFAHNPLMHGMFQFVSTSFVFRIFGASDVTLRLLPALFGTLAVATPLVLFRRHLGRSGAILTALMLAVSPGLLYFSRFARNDIYVVLWTLLLAWSIWRFLEEQRPRYLYVAAAALALSFTTKEVSYLLLFVFAVYLLARLLPSVPAILRTHPRSWPPAAALLLFLGSLSLPLSAAGIALFQNRLGLNLANPDPGALGSIDSVGYLQGPIGAPISQGPGIASRFFGAIGDLFGFDLVHVQDLENPAAGVLSLGPITLQSLDVATIVVLLLFVVGVALGLLWARRTWLIGAAIFWGIFAFIFTTHLTNLPGFASGLWQSLGYWIAQQEVARGGQPWYYYFAVLGTYEFLPLFAGIASGIYLAWKRDSFGSFLFSWFLVALVSFTYAAEKMPWLSIHLTLPLVFLAGRGLGLLLDSVLRAPGRQISFQPAMALRWGALVVVLLLLIITARSAVRASYTNGDVPLEMLVYTQTSPSIARTANEIERMAAADGSGVAFPVTIDTMDGFGWPWYWYLRDYTQIEYRCLGDPGNCGSDARPLSDEDFAQGRVLVLNAANQTVAQPYVDAYGMSVRIPFRWWFPETAYRGPNYAEGLTFGEILRGVVHPSTWSTIWTYWTQRQPPLPIGQIEVVVYFPQGYVPDLVPPVAPTDSASVGGGGTL